MKQITVIIGGKNTGKTLKAKELSLGFKNDEIFWDLQPFEYLSSIREFYQNKIKRKTKILIVDECNDSIFISNLILLSKYNHLMSNFGKFNIIIICDDNIKAADIQKKSLNLKIDLDIIEP